MAKKFEALGARAQESWSDDAQQIHEAANVVFKAEVSLQISLGKDLAAARRADGMTQLDLAQVTGVQQSEISRIENGHGNPTLETVARLTAALDQTWELAPRDA